MIRFIITADHGGELATSDPIKTEKENYAKDLIRFLDEEAIVLRGGDVITIEETDDE